MTPMLKGCLGVVLLPIAGSIALLGIAGLTADGGAMRGLGWGLVLAAAFATLAAVRLVHDGLRSTVRDADGPRAPRPPARVRSAGPALTAFVVVLGVGTVASLSGPVGLGALVPLHVLAALLPARVLTRHVGSRQDGVRAGAIGRGLAWGGLGATSIAFAGELIVGSALALVVWLALGTTPGAQDAVSDVVGQLLQSVTTLSPAAPGSLEGLSLAPLLRPSIAAAAIGLLGLAGPLLEELAKLAGVILLRPRTRAEAFLYGVAVGAGFGVLEALLTGAASIGPAWSLAIVARAAATLMHATTCGIAAVGWRRLADGEAGAGTARIGLAVALHALWNLGVLGAVLAAAAVAEGVGPAALATLAATSPLMVTLVFAFVLFAFTGMARRYGRAADAEPATLVAADR